MTSLRTNAEVSNLEPNMYLKPGYVNCHWHVETSKCCKLYCSSHLRGWSLSEIEIEIIIKSLIILFKRQVTLKFLQGPDLIITAHSQLEGEAGEPIFRRLVLRSFAHIIRLYSSSLVTESEVVLSFSIFVLKSSRHVTAAYRY